MNTLSKTQIKVRVYTDCAKEEVLMRGDNTFQVFLREPAKRGLANKKLLKILQYTLTPRPKKVRILTGARSPNKVVEIEYKEKI